MMKLFRYFTIAFLLSSYCIAQTGKKSICDCSKVLPLVSDKWKLDTLANKGYRSKLFRDLRDCRVDTFSITALIKYLGPPTKIMTYQDGEKGYRYNFYDWMYLDSSQKEVMGYGYDFLTFTTGDSASVYHDKIVYITRGTGEY